MTKLATLILVASVALTASTAASAAGAAATLRVDRGSVMSSAGGEFTSASTGKVLVEGQRLMVTEDAAATLLYANGCVREYNVPGVYLVAATCDAVAKSDTPKAWRSVALGAGVVAGGAALLDNMDQVDAPPISR